MVNTRQSKDADTIRLLSTTLFILIDFQNSFTDRLALVNYVKFIVSQASV